MGRRTLIFQLVNISQLLQEISGELHPLAQEKSPAINLDFADDLNTKTIIGDCLELHRLFTYLIGNGIKFTNSG